MIEQLLPTPKKPLQRLPLKPIIAAIKESGSKGITTRQLCKMFNRHKRGHLGREMRMISEKFRGKLRSEWRTIPDLSKKEISVVAREALYRWKSLRFLRIKTVHNLLNPAP